LTESSVPKLGTQAGLPPLPEPPAPEPEPASTMPAVPKQADHWSDLIRQVLSFVIGIAVILHALITDQPQLLQWIIGLLLMGVVPIDAVIRRLRGGSSG